MPPRKDKLSRVEFRELIRKYGIRFEGPVPPKEWPHEHRDRFCAIRCIGHTQYEHYIADQRVSKEQRKDLKQRVNYLRKRSYELLDDAKANEATWRELEQLILRRFDERVICSNCHDELWKPHTMAHFLHLENRAKLDAKRLSRRLCTCNNKRVNSKAEDSDDESRDLFDFAKEEIITHASGDGFHNVSIPMKPDRVYGLRSPSRVHQDYSHLPITGRRILLPFLVVEAKREDDAPGFRAIQYQTTFPIRRFLRAQNDVLSCEQLQDPCLVWFFAYQGEQWRLHAGTLKDDKVRVYDLWQGTIQSQDGALQLLLIVDYIWSWARDIYRPTIRSILFSAITGTRELSPASTDRFRMSISLSSASSPAPSTQDLVLNQTDRPVAMEGHPETPFIGDSTGPQHLQEQADTILKDASLHPFLKWAIGHEHAPSWTMLGSIRHSNIVHFEFQCHVVQWWDVTRVGEICTEDQAIHCVLFSSALLLFPIWLYELAALWTTRFDPIPALAHEQTVRVTFFFQTYCDPTTWQIKRVLNCILWITEPPARAPQANIRRISSAGAGDGRINYSSMVDIGRALLYVRQMHGQDSVWSALRNVSLILLPNVENQGPGWASFDEAMMPERAYETLMDLRAHMNAIGLRSHCLNLCSGLAQVDEGFQIQLRSPIRGLRQDVRTGDSMLAIRSSTSPAACPIFCLFVLSEVVFADSKESLHRALEEAIESKSYYGEDNRRLVGSEWQTLHKWRKALKVND